MRRTSLRHHTDGLVGLLLFGVFAVCVLSVLLTGAKAYRRLTERDQAAYSRRTCVQYIATRVRQADDLNGVAVEPFGEAAALVLQENGGYATKVYWYDGYLMELYAAADADLAPEDGEKIMELQSLDFSLEDQLLTVEVTSSQGVRDSLRLFLRSGEGAAA